MRYDDGERKRHDLAAEEYHGQLRWLDPVMPSDSETLDAGAGFVDSKLDSMTRPVMLEADAAHEDGLPAMMMMHPMLSQTPWGQMSFHPVMSAANPMAGWGVPVPASSQQRAPLETPSPLETRDPYPHGQSLQLIPPSDGSEPAPGANSEQAPLATTPREILNGSSSVPQNALTKRQLEEANEPTAATRGAAPGP